MKRKTSVNSLTQNKSHRDIDKEKKKSCKNLKKDNYSMRLAPSNKPEDKTVSISKLLKGNNGKQMEKIR